MTLEQAAERYRLSVEQEFIAREHLAAAEAAEREAHTALSMAQAVRSSRGRELLEVATGAIAKREAE